MEGKKENHSLKKAWSKEGVDNRGQDKIFSEKRPTSVLPTRPNTLVQKKQAKKGSKVCRKKIHAKDLCWGQVVLVVRSVWGEKHSLGKPGPGFRAQEKKMSKRQRECDNSVFPRTSSGGQPA